MISSKIIEEVKQKLIKTYNPLEIYLFGSYAWGCPDEDSDLDLLIILDHYTKDQYHTLVDGHKALIHTRVPKDLLVLSKEEFEKDAEDNTTLSYKIKRKGKKIYAKA
jgi:predicted nucleotidyltransferase